MKLESEEMNNFNIETLNEVSSLSDSDNFEQIDLKIEKDDIISKEVFFKNTSLFLKISF